MPSLAQRDKRSLQISTQRMDPSSYSSFSLLPCFPLLVMRPRSSASGATATTRSLTSSASAPQSNVSRGEAERLVSMATKLLVATENIVGFNGGGVARNGSGSARDRHPQRRDGRSLTRRATSAQSRQSHSYASTGNFADDNDRNIDDEIMIAAGESLSELEATIHCYCLYFCY